MGPRIFPSGPFSLSRLTLTRPDMTLWVKRTPFEGPRVSMLRWKKPGTFTATCLPSGESALTPVSTSGSNWASATFGLHASRVMRSVTRSRIEAACCFVFICWAISNVSFSLVSLLFAAQCWIVFQCASSMLCVSTSLSCCFFQLDLNLLQMSQNPSLK